MNYKLIYTNIIEDAKKRVKPQEYCEKHHIIPRCLGGENTKDNVVFLSGKEHFISHWLLTKIYKNDKINFAFWMMCVGSKKLQQRYIPSGKIYEKAKKLLSDTKRGKSTWIFGKHHSEETKRNISDLNKGLCPPNKGHAMSEEQKIKISKAMTGKHPSPETLIKMSLAKKGFKSNRTGYKHSVETLKKMSKARESYVCKEETRRKISESLRKFFKKTKEELWI